MQVVHDIRELFNLSLTHLWLLGSLLQLYLFVQDVVPSAIQLIVGVLQLGVGVVK
jgi:hypothetical protein